MVEASVQFHGDVDDFVDHLRVPELKHFEVIGPYHLLGEVQYKFPALPQQVAHPGFADHLFGIGLAVLLPAGKGRPSTCLKILHDPDLPGELWFHNTALPLAHRTGLKPRKILYVITVEFMHQLFLRKAGMFSA